MTASTVSIATSNKRFGRKLSGVGLVANPFTTSVATTSLDEQDDIFEIGYVPAGVTVIGFVVKSTDLDTDGTPTIVFKLQLAGSDIVTGIDVGKAGTSGFYACTPTTTTASSLLQGKVTTAATAAAAGTVYTTPIYFSAS